MGRVSGPMRPPVKHSTRQLTLYTGKIVAFGSKPDMERLKANLESRGIEAKIGHLKSGYTFYVLVWKNTRI